MNNLNLIVMGKTGAGKSTLVNAILKEDLAPTGIGQTITKANKVYSKSMLLPLNKENNQNGHYGMVGTHLNLYDTVGLEIDKNITQATLQEVKKFLQQTQRNEGKDDITLVLFCINYRSSRFEQYEIELIKELSIDYEIPFLIVITQCITEESGELEIQIKTDFPEFQITRVLASDYKTRSGTIAAHGVTELLQTAVFEYDKCKTSILEEKLNILSLDREKIIKNLKSKGTSCIESHSDKATKIGFVPGGCIPIVHGICIKMLTDLNKIVGINSGEDFSSELLASAIVGVIATPFMLVPFLSAAVAYGYVSSIGENYLDALMMVVEHSKLSELQDNKLMAERIKQELKKRKK